jgi:hypothetical protein
MTGLLAPGGQGAWRRALAGTAVVIGAFALIGTIPVSSGQAAPRPAAAAPAPAHLAPPAPVRVPAPAAARSAPARPAAQPAALPAPLPVPSWLAGIKGGTATALADQRQGDRDHREAWVAEGYGGGQSDLNALVTLTDQAQGTDRLDIDARRFSTAGYAYLSAYRNGLTPGWQDGYAQVRAALNVLAADTGQAPAPAPGGAISAAPGPVSLPAPPAVSHAPACKTATTTTNSSSSTGATSHSVSVKTTCGTASTTQASKTAVSAKGAVTHTNTSTSTG